MDDNNKLSDIQSSFAEGKGETSFTPLGVNEGEALLPCLYRNNSNEKEKKDLLGIATKYRKTSVSLAENVKFLSGKYGLKNLGFLTLTFADHVLCYREASKRFNSLATRILNTRYHDWIKVMERQKSGRIHFHLIVALDKDIRTGLDFDGLNKRNYSTANENLRSEWSFWRSTAKKYKFGRTELIPIKSSSEAIGRYVGKYISKHLDATRDSQDKGARLVSYSKGCRIMNTKFSWVTKGSQLWRSKVSVFAHLVSARTGCEPTFAGLRSQLGPKWAYNHRDYIAQLPVV